MKKILFTLAVSLPMMAMAQQTTLTLQNYSKESNLFLKVYECKNSLYGDVKEGIHIDGNALTSSCSEVSFDNLKGRETYELSLDRAIKAGNKVTPSSREITLKTKEGQSYYVVASKDSWKGILTHIATKKGNAACVVKDGEKKDLHYFTPKVLSKGASLGGLFSKIPGVSGTLGYGLNCKLSPPTKQELGLS